MSDKLSAPAICTCGFKTMSASEAAKHLKECKLISDIVEWEDGKYKILIYFNGELKCLRYGEKWRDLVGDKMVLTLCYKVMELESELAELKEVLPKEPTTFGGKKISVDDLFKEWRKVKKQLQARIDHLEGEAQSHFTHSTKLEQENEKLKKESEGRL